MRGRIAKALKKITEPDSVPNKGPVTVPTEIRTTEMSIGPDHRKYKNYPPFKDGCPKCHEKPVVVKMKFYDRDREGVEILACRCRNPGCDWEGRVQR